MDTPQMLLIAFVTALSAYKFLNREKSTDAIISGAFPYRSSAACGERSKIRRSGACSAQFMQIVHTFLKNLLAQRG